LRVAVALNDLGSNGRNAKPKAVTDTLFDFGTEMRSVATAPEILPTAICTAAARKRSMLR